MVERPPRRAVTIWVSFRVLRPASLTVRATCAMNGWNVADRVGVPVRVAVIVRTKFGTRVRTGVRSMLLAMVLR